MAAEPDLADTIAETAQGPAEVTVDGQDVRAQPIKDLIAADKYLKDQAAVEASGAAGSGWGSTIRARLPSDRVCRNSR